MFTFGAACALASDRPQMLPDRLDPLEVRAEVDPKIRLGPRGTADPNVRRRSEPNGRILSEECFALEG